MNIPLQYLLLGILGYLAGSSNMAYYLALFNHIDICHSGSGNLGASNVMVLLGKRAALATLVHDFLKAFIPVLIARYFFPDTGLNGQVLAGTMSILGHIYPFWLRFKGGKGFASYLGTVAALDWRFLLILLLAAVLITVLSDFIVFATITTVLVTPVYLAIAYTWGAALIISLASFCMLLKHRENFERLRKKEEIGLRTALSGKKRLNKKQSDQKD